ncbi:MAG: DUF3623 family protein [Caldilineaceae bacterium]
MMHLFSLYLAPALYSLFLWWFLTGLIMAFYGREPGTVRWAFVGATAVLLLAAVGVVVTRVHAHRSRLRRAYLWHAGWAWLIAGYYLGYVTGPDVAGLSQPPRAVRDSGARLRLAFQASLYHELLVLAVCLLLVWLTRSSANRLALWTFLALWIMHGISKLNVLFGVRNFHIEWLLRHMHRLGSLLRPPAGQPALSVDHAPGVADRLGAGRPGRGARDRAVPNRGAGADRLHDLFGHARADAAGPAVAGRVVGLARPAPAGSRSCPRRSHGSCQPCPACGQRMTRRPWYSVRDSTVADDRLSIGTENS